MAPLASTRWSRQLLVHGQDRGVRGLPLAASTRAVSVLRLWPRDAIDCSIFTPSGCGRHYATVIFLALRLPEESSRVSGHAPLGMRLRASASGHPPLQAPGSGHAPPGKRLRASASPGTRLWACKERPTGECGHMPHVMFGPWAARSLSRAERGVSGLDFGVTLTSDGVPSGQSVLLLWSRSLRKHGKSIGLKCCQGCGPWGGQSSLLAWPQRFSWPQMGTS